MKQKKKAHIKAGDSTHTHSLSRQGTALSYINRYKYSVPKSVGFEDNRKKHSYPSDSLYGVYNTDIFIPTSSFMTPNPALTS